MIEKSENYNSIPVDYLWTGDKNDNDTDQDSLLEELPEDVQAVIRKKFEPILNAPAKFEKAPNHDTQIDSDGNTFSEALGIFKEAIEAIVQENAVLKNELEVSRRLIELLKEENDALYRQVNKKTFETRRRNGVYD